MEHSGDSTFIPPEVESAFSGLSEAVLDVYLALRLTRPHDEQIYTVPLSSCLAPKAVSRRLVHSQEMESISGITLFRAFEAAEQVNATTDTYYCYYLLTLGCS